MIVRIFVLVALICSIGSTTFATKATKKTIEVTLNWKAEPEFGGFYQAVLGKTLKRSWEELAVVEGGASTPTIQMVAAGKIDFAIANGDEVVISQALGTDVVALFATYQTDPHGIMVREDSGVQNLKELLSKPDFTIALQRGIGSTLFVQKKFAPVKAKIVPFTGGITNYLADKKFAQQCFVTSEPLAAKKQGKPARAFLIADEGYNPYSVVLVTRKQVIARDPELVKAVVAAVRQGWMDYLAKPEAANKHMAGLNKSMDLETFNKIAIGQKNLIETADTKKSGLGTMTAARWKILVDQLFEMKLIKKKPDPTALFQNL